MASQVLQVVRDERTIVTGDLNICWGGQDPRDIEITTRLEAWGATTSVADHFRTRRRYRGKGTWKHPDRTLRLWVQCDYIIAGCRRDWVNFRHRKLTYLPTDHEMIMGTIRVLDQRDHRRYVRNRTRNPLGEVQKMLEGQIGQKETSPGVMRRTGKGTDTIDTIDQVIQ